MVTVKPFNLEVIKTHKCFYLLRHINNAIELQIVHNTPAGYIETSVADAFSMPNGEILIAWDLPLHTSTMHNLLVIYENITETVNLASLERIIDIYNKPVDAQIGVFSFTNSDMIIAPDRDWRCDNGKFGPMPFANPEGIFETVDGIVIYEPILSFNGIGHIVYVEGVGKQDLANAYLNKDTRPVSGRTFWETLKLVNEWAIVYQPPFNNTEAVAYKAHAFINELKLNEAEKFVIDQQIPMHIANYLMGNTNARQRPDGVLPITEEIKQLLFNRLASGSVSALEYLNPGMWDLQELIEAEQEQLLVDVQTLFRNTPTGWGGRLPNVLHTRYLNNKKLILDMVSNQEL